MRQELQQCACQAPSSASSVHDGFVAAETQPAQHFFAPFKLGGREPMVILRIPIQICLHIHS